MRIARADIQHHRDAGSVRSGNYFFAIRVEFKTVYVAMGIDERHPVILRSRVIYRERARQGAGPERVLAENPVDRTRATPSLAIPDEASGPWLSTGTSSRQSVAEYDCRL